MKSKVILSGTIWTSASTITTAIVQILRLSILARFLEKSDFGVVAILTIVLGFTSMFSELGFSTIIMHKQNISKKEFSSLYWLQFFLYLLIYLLISSCSILIADFFNEPTIVFLLPIAMLDLILYGIGRLYDTVMQKELKFSILAKRNIIAAFISLIVAIFLALKGAGVYSLVLSTLTQSIILNLWNLIHGVKFIPLKLYCSLKLVKPMLSMGLHQTGSHILDYISTQADVFIIGKLLGSEVLGTYNLAKELILKGTMLVNSIVNRVSLPLFAKKQDDKESLRNNYCKLISFVSFINFPISTIIGSLGYIIVPIMYGDKYFDVISILFVISIWGIVNCIGNPISNIIISTGRTDIAFKYTLIRLTIYIPIMCLLSRYNIITLAWGVVLLTTIFVFISWYMNLYLTISLEIKQFVKSFIYPMIFTIFAGFVGFTILNYFNKIESNFTTMILIAFIWILLYLCIYAFIERHTIRTIVSMLK